MDINKKEKQNTLLLAAIEANEVNDMFDPINAGADVNSTDRLGRTPLMLSMANGNVFMTDFFMTEGAKLDVADVHGNNLLHYVATSGSDELMIKALNFNIDVNAVNQKGDTPVMIAMMNRDLKLVTTLYLSGAILEYQKKSLLIVALEKRISIEMIGLLIAMGSDVDAASDNHSQKSSQTALMLAIPHSLASLDLLIKNKANVNAVTESGTALTNAVNAEKFKCVERFFEAGADVNLASKSSGTPLLNAFKKGNMKIVEYLMEHGAKLNFKKGEGLKALECCTNNKKIQMVSIIENLVLNEATVNAAKGGNKKAKNTEDNQKRMRL